MSIKKVGSWGGALSIRLTQELKEIGIKEGDEVITKVNNGVIIIERKIPEFKTNCVKFSVKNNL